ncbi:MAG TPA: hypothetical protein VK581_12430 [Chthoniobacterales bacterium]|nr:hypothetical protein [Chthoniobacterales bacterium]
MTAQEHIKDIERIVQRSSPGPNDDALQAIRKHVAHLRSAATTTYASGKADDILEWSEIYFSTRKHQNYGGGAEQVRVWILGACGSLEVGLRRDE